MKRDVPSSSGVGKKFSITQTVRPNNEKHFVKQLTEENNNNKSKLFHFSFFTEENIKFSTPRHLQVKTYSGKLEYF